MKFRYHYLAVLTLAMMEFNTHAQPKPVDVQAEVRAKTVLSIEQKISDMVHASKDWEQAEFRSYRQEDIDGDGIDDTVLLTTFEHENTWRRELFVCLSASPKKVMHLNLGSKGERQADSFQIKDKVIIIKGKLYGKADAMCCPSVPYESQYVVSDGKIAKKQ